MNRVILAGRLTRDVDLRQSENGFTSARFTVAVDRRTRKDGESNADFITCVAFSKTAEFVEKYFSKGSRIILEGRIQTGSYKNQNGDTVYTTDVVADNIEFGGDKAASKDTTQDEPAPEALPWN